MTSPATTKWPDMPLKTQATEYLGRAFDAASRRDRTAGWRAGGTSANAEIGDALATLQARSRELARNDPHVARALEVIRTNVVGSGIRAQLDGDSPLERLWKQWAESTDCDADGVHDLYGLQSLVMRATAESGEVLVRMRPRRQSDGLAVPLQLQVIESDHIDTSKDGPADKEGHTWIQGVEIDALGRRTGYWLFREHPGDTRRLRSLRSLNSVFVPAESILHIYRQDRPGQMRGIPWCAPIAVRARELRDYEDAQLLRQKIAACFAVFREDAFVDGDDGTGAPKPVTGEELGEDTLRPGMMVDVPAGKKVAFAQPPAVAGYDEFVTRSLRAVAVGMGVSYEAMTGDFSKVNFSSGRMGHIEFQRNVQSWQRGLLINRFCRPVWRWFVDVAMLLGDVDDLAPTWIPPRREMIDPTREVPAIIQKIRGGLSTLSDELRAEGHDPQDVFQRLKEEREMLLKMGVVTESDPSMATDWRMSSEY